MQIRLFLILFSLLNSLAHHLDASASKFLCTAKSSCLSTETKIEYKRDNTVVGYIYHVQVPFSISVMHSFYVYPEFRGKGYGKELLRFAFDHLKRKGSQCIFIQPGPFELDQDGDVNNIKDSPERHEKIQRLIKLYASAGFTQVNRLVVEFSKLLYYFAHIEENPAHLMVG